MISVAARFLIRLHLCRRHKLRFHFGLDDGFLLFGLACASAATTLILVELDFLFQLEAIAQGKLLEADRANVAAAFAFSSRVLLVYWALLWAAMCSVKFSFLFFFKKLISGLDKTIKAWWWAAFALTVVTFTYGLITIVALCPSNDSVSAGMSLLLLMNASTASTQVPHISFHCQLNIAPFQTELSVRMGRK